MLYINKQQHLLRYLYISAIGLIGLVFLSFYLRIFVLDRAEIEVVTLVNWLLLSAILAKALPKGIWSISFIFFAVFSVFHGGLIFVSALGALTDKDIIYTISFWFHLFETEVAIYLVNLAMIVYALFVTLFSRPVQLVDEDVDLQYIKRIHHIGGAMLVVMVTFFIAFAVVTGAGSSYGAYLNVLSQSPGIALIFIYMYLFIGLAIVFVTVSYRPGFGYWYFIAFGIWAALAFRLGLRGEVLFPSAVAAAMLGRRTRPIRTSVLMGLIAVLLVATVVVKNARISGDYSNIDNMNPLNAVAEMGASLRAVTEVIKWRNGSFELLYGGSYWAPFERQFALFLPQLDRLPVHMDVRLLNVVVQERVGPIGFSPVAEAYINFGERGVLLMAIVLALLFARLDRVLSTVRTDIIIGVAIIPLFIMIRNSFTFVPVQVVVGVVLALIILQLAKVRLKA